MKPEITELTIGVSRTAIIHRIMSTLFYHGSGVAKMSQSQIDGIDNYIDQWAKLRNRGYRIPVPYLAYTLATVYHETAYKMQPIEEYGHGKGHEYGEIDPITGKAYYGRGDVQVTWKYNYERLSKIVVDHQGKKGVDLVTQPELMLNPHYSTQATLLGFALGLYTGKRAERYLDFETPDYVNARRCINGTDKAEIIAGYAKRFEQALNLGHGRAVDRTLLKVGVFDNPDVVELQLALHLSPDGDYGKRTEEVVKNFQELYGLVVDGIVGRRTWNVIENVTYWPESEQTNEYFLKQ